MPRPQTCRLQRARPASRPVRVGHPRSGSRPRGRRIPARLVTPAAVCARAQKRAKAVMSALARHWRAGAGLCGGEFLLLGVVRALRGAQIAEQAPLLVLMPAAVPPAVLCAAVAAVAAVSASASAAAIVVVAVMAAAGVTVGLRPAAALPVFSGVVMETGMRMADLCKALHAEVLSSNRCLSTRSRAAHL